MKIYNVGIVGFGGFGHFLRNSWQQLDNVRVVAAADEIAERNPGKGVKFYSKWQDLAQDPNVDIVSICTPPSSHAAIACGVMRAGKNVLIEKPIATSFEDGRKIIEVRNKTGKVATVNYMIRFNPLMEAIAMLAKEKVFGELRHFNLENYAQDQGLPSQHWFWDKDIAGGILIEHAVHFIDILHSLTDQKHTAVVGLCHNRNQRQEDQVFAGVHYDGGLIATHYHSFARPGFFEDTSIRLNFDLAEIDINGWIPLSGKVNAIIDSSGKEKLRVLPNVEVIDCTAVNDMVDHSRPKGRGDVGQSVQSSQAIQAGGVDYTVEENVIASFSINKDKQDVYADGVRAMITDLIAKIENPSHKLRVSLEDGLTSLDIACQATKMGRES